jgi:hypothetical protein
MTHDNTVFHHLAQQWGYSDTQFVLLIVAIGFAVAIGIGYACLQVVTDAPTPEGHRFVPKHWSDMIWAFLMMAAGVSAHYQSHPLWAMFLIFGSGFFLAESINEAMAYHQQIIDRARRRSGR